MDQKDRVVWELEMENRASHPDQKFPGIPPPPPWGTSVIVVWMLVSFTVNHNPPWMLRCRPKAEVTSGEAREACSFGYGLKELFRAGHHKDLSETRNSAWKVSCTQSIPNPASVPDFSESRFPGSSQIPYPVNTSLIPHCILLSPGSRE